MRSYPSRWWSSWGGETTSLTKNSHLEMSLSKGISVHHTSILGEAIANMSSMIVKADPTCYKHQGSMEGLDSKDWIKVCESLNDARRFSLYHTTLLLPILEKLMLVVVKAMKNCKTSIIFNAFGEKLLDSGAFDQLVVIAVVTEGCNGLSLLLLCHCFKSFADMLNHGNIRNRAKAAVSISSSVLQMRMKSRIRRRLGKAFDRQTYLPIHAQ
ncbi:hypothetical protein PTKIN_Ptkin10aG0017900 [Pterospermum kingtungense]